MCVCERVVSMGRIKSKYLGGVVKRPAEMAGLYYYRRGECVLDRNQYSRVGSRQKETSQAVRFPH